MIEKAVILSAGRGLRFNSYTESIPKCLIEIGDRTILEQQIVTLQRCGIRKIAVVTGYKASMICERLCKAGMDHDVEYIYNPDFDNSENLVSLWMARHAFVDTDCLILNGDTLVAADIITALCEIEARYPIILASDAKPAYDEDDMKLLVSGDLVVRIGKTICTTAAQGEAIGLSRITRRGTAMLAAVLDDMVATSAGRQSHYPAAYQNLADMGAVGYSMITRSAWFEIDSLADLETANRQVDAFHLSPIPPSLASPALLGNNDDRDLIATG